MPVVQPRPAAPGRPRDHDIDRAVLAATLSVLDEAGYPRLTIEEVARRAGTTKPAVYRRWPARPRLALAALATRLAEIDAPDTGCTLCDLNEALVVFVDAFRRIRPEVIGPLLADCSTDHELRRRFMTTLFDPPRDAVARTLDRATARGDLRSDLDRDLVLDMLGSLVHYRVLFEHEPLGPADIEQAVEALLRGAATDYPRLLAHSRRTRDHTTHRQR